MHNAEKFHQFWVLLKQCFI